MTPQPKPPEPVCSGCQKATAAPCGRAECPNRKPLTADFSRAGYRQTAGGCWVATKRSTGD